MAKNIQSIERATMLFESMVASGGAGVSELADKFLLNKSTVFSIIKTLEALGYIYKCEETNNYMPTFRIKTLAASAADIPSIVRFAHPILLNILGKYGETVHFVRAKEDTVVYLDKIESTKSIRIHTNIGSEMPLHCTSVGKAVLSCRAQEEVIAYADKTGLPVFTQRTIHQVDDLLGELAKIREQGYSVDNEESIEGLYCIGVPICSGAGEALYALSLSMPKYRVNKVEKQQIIADIKLSQQKIMAFF